MPAPTSRTASSPAQTAAAPGRGRGGGPADEAPDLGKILAQVGFVIVAALFVYGFVAVTKEGETRRVCSAPCFLHPDYMAADRRAPDFTLKDLQGASVSLE